MKSTINRSVQDRMKMSKRVQKKSIDNITKTDINRDDTNRNKISWYNSNDFV